MDFPLIPVASESWDRFRAGRKQWNEVGSRMTSKKGVWLLLQLDQKPLSFWNHCTAKNTMNLDPKNLSVVWDIKTNFDSPVFAKQEVSSQSCIATRRTYSPKATPLWPCIIRTKEEPPEGEVWAVSAACQPPEQRRSLQLSCRTQVHLWWVWAFPAPFLQEGGFHVFPDPDAPLWIGNEGNQWKVKYFSGHRGPDQKGCSCSPRRGQIHSEILGPELVTVAERLCAFFLGKSVRKLCPVGRKWKQFGD